MTTMRTPIKPPAKTGRITPHAVQLFKRALQTDDVGARDHIENELNLELKLQSWHIPYRRDQWPTVKYIDDVALPKQLEKIVAAILAPDQS